MAEMKGIKLCGECGNYDWKKHKCKIGCNDDSNAQASFYGDCPLPDVVPKSEVEQVKWERDVAIKQLEEIGLSFGEKTDGYGNLTEYAREIFEEIEKILKVQERYLYCNPSLTYVYTLIEELKKKYTKSEGKE